MRELTIAEQAARLILAATGEEYGDGDIVTDLVIGYAEPGYGSDDAVIVFGNWNDKRPQWGWQVRALSGDRFTAAPNTTKADSIPSRLANALEKLGVDVEWSDEWASCNDCYRALRTQADSYSWTMYGAWGEDGITCRDCMLRDVEGWLEEYAGDATRAITWCGPTELSAAGFVQWEPGNEQEYASGWYGREDKPDAILATILEHDESAEVVFLVTGVGQFEMSFAAWVRTTTTDDEES